LSSRSCSSLNPVESFYKYPSYLFAPFQTAAITRVGIFLTFVPWLFWLSPFSLWSTLSIRLIFSKKDLGQFCST
jgi:hypothetical protein